MRPHEVFALVLDDIVLDVSHPYLDVIGTLVEENGAGAGDGCASPRPSRRTDGGGCCSPNNPSKRSVRQSKTSRSPTAPTRWGLLFPARNRSLRNSNNFGRTWRAARGEDSPWSPREPSARRGDRGRSRLRQPGTGGPSARQHPRGRQDPLHRRARDRAPTTAPFWKPGRAGRARKREISVRWVESRHLLHRTKTPSDAGRKGFSLSG